MVESTALEMRHTGNRIGGSNPSLSAIGGNNLLIKHSNFSPFYFAHGATHGHLNEPDWLREHSLRQECV